MITMTIKSNEYKTFALFHVSILQSYAILVTFKGFPVFEIRKNLDLRKILSTPKIFLKSRFHCTYNGSGARCDDLLYSPWGDHNDKI